jgi:hypothetical protein
MNTYQEFFETVWENRYAEIGEHRIRILYGRTNQEYINASGVVIANGTVEITVLSNEIEAIGWKPNPLSRLSIEGRQYQVFSDIAPTPQDPDGTLLKITIHPV